MICFDRLVLVLLGGVTAVLEDVRVGGRPSVFTSVGESRGVAPG
jgi:hypothetical protein